MLIHQQAQVRMRGCVTVYAGDRPSKRGKREYCHDVKELLNRAYSHSKLATPAKRFIYTNAFRVSCVFRLRVMMAALPFTFLVRAAVRSFTPLALSHDAADLQPRTEAAVGPEAIRPSVCLIMAKEVVALHRLLPGPSRFVIIVE